MYIIARLVVGNIPTRPRNNLKIKNCVEDYLNLYDGFNEQSESEYTEQFKDDPQWRHSRND